LAEPESLSKELDRKELSKEFEEMLELPEEPYHDSEEEESPPESDESKAVIVVVVIVVESP